MTEKHCDNCDRKESDQALVDHAGSQWCLDCMRMAGRCISCDADIRQLVDDFYEYDEDMCPKCLTRNT